ncbi:hypothetical protein EXIGLDRAFT_774363 [Exidia glandulosa HHB12029]|uniref:Ricin B lectin domain-containing protein n=1 Tax=Exidia glandulosa HHB12029 TaxID=1314781 RepID=A0A165EE62_EXIGL|nr:hypothetical protein EXIGLDRAFT_774363 [Exidia glandulosa HHB12029]
MRLLFSLLGVVLATFTVARAAAIVNSGVYTINIGSRALTHVNGSTHVTAETLSGASNQVWTVILDSALPVGRIQNVATLAFISPDGIGGVAATTPGTTWVILQESGQNIFCLNGSVCISLTSSNSNTLVVRSLGTGDTTQFFNGVVTLPPNGPYQIVNEASDMIFGAGFVPSPTFVTFFPATDRSEIWFVTRTSASAITMLNFDSGGKLSLSSNGSVGVFGFNNVAWTVQSTSIGQVIIPPSGGFLTVGSSTLSIGNFISSASTWVFQPVDGNSFLPRRI